MSQLKIAVFIGSLHKDSHDRRLARAVEKLAPTGPTFPHAVIADDGTIDNDGTGKFLQGFVDSHAAWIRRFAR